MNQLDRHSKFTPTVFLPVKPKTEVIYFGMCLC